MAGPPEKTMRIMQREGEMQRIFSRFLVIAWACLSVSYAGAVIRDATFVGTWNLTPGIGNPVDTGGPGMSRGQKFTIKVSYDDTSTVLTSDVLTESFTDSGQDMSVIELTGGSNTIEISIPMAGFDGETRSYTRRTRALTFQNSSLYRHLISRWARTSPTRRTLSASNSRATS